MIRNISMIADKAYDLIIVGGGIFGVCAAWDAALRGLSVALLERRDFAHATSANCFKIVHGGIRYLQHADLYRIRESSQERNALLRIAPHLVHPLPILIPTYRHGMQGKEILRIALLAYDLITFDRNRGLKDPQKRIPSGRSISREDCLRLFPGLQSEDLTGAVVFHDGQIYNTARLALSYLKSAVKAGADASNYIEVEGFLQNEDRVIGIKARDTLTGDKFEIHGKVVLNAAGPWAEKLLQGTMDLRLKRQLVFSRDAYFVVGRHLTGKYALAVQGKTSDPDAILNRGGRHLFIVPWQNYTIIGVWHVVHKGPPESFTVTDDELQGFLDEINDAYPPLALKLEDILMWNAGLVLFGDNQPGATDLSYGKRSLIIDHRKDHGIEGLITLVGVRYTTSRGVAAKVVDLVLKKLGRNAPKSKTVTTPIYGGQIDRFDEFLDQAIEQRPLTLSVEAMRTLLHNHGSEYREVLKYIDEDPRWAETLGASKVIKAEVINAVRQEMAQKLGDLVFRRTDLGTGSYPGEAALQSCANLMASELGWDEEQIRIEIDEVKAAYPYYIRAKRLHKSAICGNPHHGYSLT